MNTPTMNARALNCGSLMLQLAGTEVVLRASGALWLAGARTLVVSDLHLEKGSAYARRGQLLPPYDTRETLRRLAAEVAATQARSVVLLGDTLHDAAALERMAPGDRQALEAMAPELIWVEGNHERHGGKGDGPRGAGSMLDSVTVAGLRLRHEPSASLAPHHLPPGIAGEVAGHLHPCARVRAPGARLRRPAFITDGVRLILPAFGAYAGGLNVRDRAFAGLFAHQPLVVVTGHRALPIPAQALIGD